jgi:protein gp37
MADNTPIEWADATVNAINGCTVLSPGCKHCYAMKLAGTRLKHHPSREGRTLDTTAGPVWNGTVRLHEPALLQPLRWQRPRTIFWNAHGDTFHPAATDDQIWRMFDVIRATQDRHQHLVLTKRPARMVEFVKAYTALPREVNNFYGRSEDFQLYQPLRNTWYGTSAEDQPRADERIADLLPIAVATARNAGIFVSFEPLLGPIDVPHLHLLDGVIVGGESGPDARPMHPDWARSIRDQCEIEGVDFHFKQWGEYLPEGQRDATKFQWAPGQDGRVHWWQPEPPYGQPLPDGACSIRIGKKKAGRFLDRVTHDALPWRSLA